MLGDLIISEPKARIGFAGKRVIQDTVKEELPADFQTSEKLLEAGFIDKIVNRKDLRDFIEKNVDYFVVKIFVKNFLGVLILLTIIYIVFLGFNIFKFLNSSDDLISVKDYKNTIDEYKDNVNDIYSELEDIKIVSENSSIRLNFDGTPVSWVLILKQDKDAKELEAIREELLQNGFNSFIF